MHGIFLGGTYLEKHLESALDTHLHLEIQRNGAYIDPMEYLK